MLKRLAFAAVFAALSAPGFAAADEPPARWRTVVCAGVSGLSPENAQYVVDRISARAQEVGLRTGEPGCTSNILVVFTTDANGQASSFARERTDPASATGLTGETRGLEALAAFETSTAPVRWWQVTRRMSENGEMADRNLRFNQAAQVRVPERGRLGAATYDAISHVVVIADLRQVNGYRLGAIADYIALVALTPVDPATDRAGQATILNLFNDRAGGRAPADTLTSADQAFLADTYR